MPLFPYPPDVNTDLRVLFRKDREGRTSRDLGLSSITKGEGSLDLYDTDDGPVSARYGDLPGGGFGVGFTHRGTFWNVSDLIGTAQDGIATNGGRLDGHATRLGAAEGRLDGHATRLGSAEGRLDGAEGRLDNHAGRIGGAEGRLDTHAGRIGATETKNGQQDGRLDNHASRIGGVEGDTSSLASRMGSAEGRLDSHVSRIGAAEGVNSTQNGRLDSHASRVGAVETRVAAMEAKQDRLEDKIDSIAAWRGNLINMSQRLRALDSGPEFTFPYIG